MCGEAGRYLHWGATTQDIMDTATVLQVRDALALIESELADLRSILVRLAKRHRDTPMAGRTHLQHALPITFVTRWSCGWRCSTGTRSASRNCARGCWSANWPALRARLRARDTGSKCSGRLMGNWSRRALATWHVARDGLPKP